MKIFYDHLILIEEVFDEIELLEADSEEKNELKKTIDSIVHHKVLIYILDSLPREHHEYFLEKLHSSPHDVTHFRYLEEKIQKDIKGEIARLGKKLKAELRADIKKHKKK